MHKHWCDGKPIAKCEAEDRITRALYAMRNDWHDGRFDYAKIRGMLTGRDTPDCAEQCGTSAKLDP